MKVWEIKYKSAGGESKFFYYKAKNREDVSDVTQLYQSYPDCKEEINQVVNYESIKTRESLINFFKNK